MSDLSISEMKEKLAMVERDLETLRKQGSSGRKLEVLSEYRDYIKDEIRMLEIEENLNASKS